MQSNIVEKLSHYPFKFNKSYSLGNMYIYIYTVLFSLAGLSPCCLLLVGGRKPITKVSKNREVTPWPPFKRGSCFFSKNITGVIY